MVFVLTGCHHKRHHQTSKEGDIHRCLYSIWVNGYWSSSDYSFRSALDWWSLSGFSISQLFSLIHFLLLATIWLDSSSVLRSTSCIRFYVDSNTYIQQMYCIATLSRVTCFWMQTATLRLQTSVWQGRHLRQISWPSML